MLRKLIQAGAALALLTGTASAQFMPSLKLGSDKPPPTQEEIDRQKALDNAYNSANKKIPDKQGAADPWGTVRPNEPQAKSGSNPPPAKKNAGSPQAKNNSPPQAKNGQ